jgi:hypothetical protein
MVVAEPILVPIVVMVPSVIVFNTPMFSVPITSIILLSVVAWLHPSSARVGRSRVITFMPFIVPSYGIPIATDPHVLWPWARGDNDYTGARRRPDSDSQGNLSVRHRYAGHQHRGKQ